MFRRLVTGFLAVAAVAVLAGACGGKVDGVSQQGSAPPSGPTPGRRPVGAGGSGSIPGRPPPAPASAASIAAEIAATYCKTFSSCCVSSGQPPIDVSRCREIITAEATAVLEQQSTFDNASAEACVDAIEQRMSLCGKEDVAWQTIKGSPPLFAASSLQAGCEAVVGRTNGTKAMLCKSGIECLDGYACAVDECVPNQGLGGSCAKLPCLDGFACNGTTCELSAVHDVGEMCVTDAECKLGLVCANGTCLPARQFPELYERRSSPYRVGADTCKAFTYL